MARETRDQGVRQKGSQRSVGKRVSYEGRHGQQYQRLLMSEKRQKTENGPLVSDLGGLGDLSKSFSMSDESKSQTGGD